MFRKLCVNRPVCATGIFYFEIHFVLSKMNVYLTLLFERKQRKGVFNTVLFNWGVK